jgi:hypothetical protein
MGRLKIKKKDVVIPFRETLAYRMILLAISVLFFVFTLYQTIVSLRGNNTVMLIIAAALTAVAVLAVFYNIGHLRDAWVPERTLTSMKRR